MEGVHKGVAACRWHASSDRPSRQARRRESPPLELNYSTFSPSHAGRLSHLGAARAWEGVGGGYRCPCPTAVADAKGRHALWAASPERLSVFLSGTPSQVRNPPARGRCAPVGRAKRPTDAAAETLRETVHRTVSLFSCAVFLRNPRSWDSVPHPASFL